MLSRSMAAFAAVSFASLGIAHAGVITQFNGIGLAQEEAHGLGYIPPDMGGAVGPTYIMQAVNGAVAVYTRTGAQAKITIPDTTFWRNAGISFSALAGGVSDPRIIYDPASGRYFVTAITIENGLTNHVLIARSNSNNPVSGGFKAVSFASTSGQFADFPTLGVTANGVTIGTNNFNSAGNYTGSSLYSLPKAGIVQTTPTASGITRFDNVGGALSAIAPDGFSFQPATNLGSSTTTTVVASDGFGNGTFHVETLSKTSVAHGAVLSPSKTVNSGIDGFPTGARQPTNVADPLDAGDNRLSAVTYQAGNYVYLARTIGNGSNDSVHWAVLNTLTNTLLSQGTISNPNMDYYYPSIAANAAGNFVIALNGSGPGTNISAYDVVCDNIGTSASCGAPQLLKSGLVGNYDLTFGSGDNRWGDYSAIALDPLNSNDFWTFLEYPSASNLWSTVITEVSGTSATNVSNTGTGGNTGQPGGNLTAIAAPEPASLALLTSGLLGYLTLRRRRREP